MIRIEGKDQPAMLKTVEQAENNGARFVHIQGSMNNETLKQDQLAFFSNKQDAGKHQYEQAAQGKFGEVLPLVSLKHRLERALELDSLTRSPDMPRVPVFMDEKFQAFVERARIEITREHLNSELKQKGIKPDLKAFQEHLRNDDASFTIKGCKFDKGEERPYLITIAQNSDRLFTIRKIEPELNNEQIKQTSFRSKTLDGLIKPSNIEGISMKLSEEKGRGNRFISFPAGKNGLTEKDITGSKTAFAALEKATKRTTDKEKHMVKSIRAVETELKPLLDLFQEKDGNIVKHLSKGKGSELSP